MSTEKVVRYTAEEMRSLAFSQERCRKDVSLALQQAARTESDVSQLVDAVKDAEQMLFDAAYAFRKIGLEWHGYAETCDSRRAKIKEALARFQQ